jgi:succinate-semialdehyde dehydrogenase/glutarate-semialdehyde dehydrogenase
MKWHPPRLGSKTPSESNDPVPYASVNPATGDFVAQFAYTGEGGLDAALDRAALTFRTDWGIRTPADRGFVLRRCAALMRIERARLARLVTLEMGKLLSESLLEVDAAADLFDRHGREVAGDVSVAATTAFGSALSDVAPTGVVLCVETWNFPLFELARVVAPNLAVGNTVLVRHSEATPLSAAAFEQLLVRSAVPVGAFAVVYLTSDLLARAMHDSRVRGISLHGLAGPLVAQAVATGKPVQITCRPPAGTDVFAVLDDADLSLAVALAVEGRLANCGQMCSGAKRFLVMDAVAEEFTDRLQDAMHERDVGDPLDPSVTLGPLSGPSVLEHTLGLIDQALYAGAHVVTGGRQIDRPGSFMAPTVLGGVTPDNPVLGEELFAPVAMVVRIHHEHQVVEQANRRPGGIGGSILSKDPERAAAIARRIREGTVFFNNTALSRKPASMSPGPQGGSLSELPVRAFARPRPAYHAW